MQRHKIKLLALFLTLSLITCCATAALSSDQEKVLEQFAQVTHIDKIMTTIQQYYLTSLTKATGKDFVAKHIDEVNTLFNKNFPEDKAKLIIYDTYVKYFTIDEIKHLVKVYKDPVIQKLIEQNSKIIAEIYDAENDLIKKNSPKLQQEFLGLLQDYWEKQAKLGVVEMQYQLGHYYVEEAKDATKGFYWIEQAAENGNIWAMNDLGIFYNRGIGTTKNPKEAVKWYTQAAEAGDETAMFNLGLEYFYGSAVAKDYKKSFTWFNKSALRDNIFAKIMLAKCYFLGLGVAKSATEGDDWLLLAAHNYYNARFADQIKTRDKYINTFLIYQKSQFFGTKPDYPKETTEDMIKQAHVFGDTIAKASANDSYI